MFGRALNVKALTLVMKAPMPWGYFGLNEVSLLVEPYSFMIISGATSPDGERCLSASATGLIEEACLDAIAAGGGREVFRFEGEQLLHVASQSCMALADSGTQRVEMQDCDAAMQAQDGRASWHLTSNAQLKLLHAGNLCLILEDGAANVKDCDDASQMSGARDKFLLAAVPELDLSSAVSVKNGAVLLAATASRQRQALANLQGLLPSLDGCKLPSLAVNVSRSWKPAVLLKANATVEMTRSLDDVAMIAIGKIYSATGADVEGAVRLIRESSSALVAAEGKLSSVSL